MTELAGVLAGELADRQPCLEIGAGTGYFVKYQNSGRSVASGL
jgi:hypothetical protein